MPPKHSNKKSSSTKKRPATGKKSILKKTKPTITVIQGKGDYRPTSLNRVRGHGDYFGDILGALGSKAGSFVGNALQGGFRKITGFGDYRESGPRSNSLVQMATRPSATSGPASQASFEMGAMSVKFGGAAPRVQHREFVCPILSTGPAFSTQVLRIQPGLLGSSVLFPWGSSVANCFQQYILHGMILEFASTSSDFSNSSALGTVMMSTLYDAGASPLANQTEINNHEFTTTNKPSTSFYHPIECASRDSPVSVRYVRSSNSTLATQDERLDDVGIFQISTVGLTAPVGTQIGELWATYDIEFLKAALPDIHVGTTYQAKMAGKSGDLGDVYFTPNAQNSLPAILTFGPSSIRIQMPEHYNGNYLLTLMVTGANGNSTLANTTALGAFGTDIALVNILPAPGEDVGQFAAFAEVAGTYQCAFSTIAENLDENYIVITLTNAPDSAYFILTSTVVIAPLDNDVSLARKDIDELAVLKARVAAMMYSEEQRWAQSRDSQPAPVAQSPSPQHPSTAQSTALAGRPVTQLFRTNPMTGV